MKKDRSALRDAIKELNIDLIKKSLKTRNRALPFGDNFSDRWQKAELLRFGKGTSMYDSCLVIGDVKIGKNCWIGPFTVLDGSGGLKIGSHCSISAGVQIYSHDSVKWALSGGKAEYEHAPVKIGNNCYIGPNAVLAKGIKIGDRCVIGANSFVNRSIPSNSIVFGTPAKVMGSIIRNKKGPLELRYNRDRADE